MNKIRLNNSILPSLLLALLAILLTLIVLSQANPGLTLPDRDYGIFSYIGQQITLGKLPYKDAWDHKPPAIFYVDALGLWMAHDLRWGIWAIEFVSLIAAIWLSYTLIKKLWGVSPAICGMVIWLIGMSITLQGGNTTEEFPLPLHFLALILFLRLAETPDNYFDGLIIGLTFSISFLFRANNAMVETAVVLALLLIWSIRRKFSVMLLQLTSMAIGAFLPILVTCLYFWSQGIFKEMFDASITYNVIYTETKLSSTPGLVAGFQNLGVIAWIGLIGYGVVLFQFFSQWRTRSKPSAILLLLIIGCPLAVVTTDPAQRNYAHYFINWLPFIALLSGLIFSVIQNGVQFKIKLESFSESLYLGFVLMTALVFFAVSGLAVENGKAFANVLNRSSMERKSTISIHANNNTRPGDTVLFWGGFPGENLMADRASPSAYITYPLLLNANLSDEFSNQFLLDLTHNHPVLIVDMDYPGALSLNPKKRSKQLAASQQWPYLPSNIGDVLKFIDSNYHVDATFRNATVYRLNGTSASQ